MSADAPLQMMFVCARTRAPATIASAKRLVVAVQQEIIYTTHNNTDGAILTIYYWWVENCNKLL